MATFVAPAPSSSARKMLEPGNYVARCVQMLLLGTHAEEFQGEKKRPAMKIRLGWEFPTELETFSEDKGEEPYFMGKEFNFSMHEKSALRIALEGWRGAKWTDEDAYKFDVGKLLGVPCLINIVAYAKKDNSQGVKIDSIKPLVKGMSCPAQLIPNQALTFDDFDFALFESLPDFIKDKIKASPEYQEMTQPKYQDPTEKLFGKDVDPNEPLPF